MRSITLSALLLLACSPSAPTGPAPNETCSAPTACGSKGSYLACTDGTECRLLASDGTSFACAGCADCASAAGQASSWCAGSSSGGAVQLKVGAVASPSTISFSKPSTGRYFLTVGLTLVNVSVPTPIPVALTSYRLASAGGLTITPSGLSAALASPCPADVSVNSGGQYACSVAFEVPSQDTAAALNYDDNLGHKASATVSFTPPPQVSSCESTVAWQKTGSASCKGCLSTAANSGSCRLVTNTYNLSCSSEVMRCSCYLQTDPKALCDCESQCFNSDCQDNILAVHDCLVTACGAMCP